jgi:hypothetical protein
VTRQRGTPRRRLSQAMPNRKTPTPLPDGRGFAGLIPSVNHGPLPFPSRRVHRNGSRVRVTAGVRGVAAAVRHEKAAAGLGVCRGVDCRHAGPEGANHTSPKRQREGHGRMTTILANPSAMSLARPSFKDAVGGRIEIGASFGLGPLAGASGLCGGREKKTATGPMTHSRTTLFGVGRGFAEAATSRNGRERPLAIASGTA